MEEYSFSTDGERQDFVVATRPVGAGAIYPVRIDPTFSDSDWVVLNHGLPGGDALIDALAAADQGYLYAGGDFMTAGGQMSPDLAQAIVLEGGPEIRILGNGVEISFGDLFPSSEDGTDFGNSRVRDGEVLRTFVVENIGAADLHLSSSVSQRVLIEGTGAPFFRVVSQPGSDTIPSGGAATFTVGFTPSINGTHRASVSIANDDEDEGSFVFQVRGSVGASLVTSIPPPAVSPQEGAELGYSVAVDGNYVIAGTPYDDHGSANSGVVKVFDSTTGHLLHVIVNPSPRNAENFGVSVALSGTILAVGSYRNYLGSLPAGSVHVYDLSGPSPTTPLFTINNPTPASEDRFGNALALEGTTLVVGAYRDDTGATDAGSVYVYDLGSATPTDPLVTIHNPEPGVRDYFGWSVAVSGTRVLVGAYGDDSLSIDGGSAYLFDLSGGTPSVPVITWKNVGSNDRFGSSVGIEGSKVVIGADGDDYQITNSGSAFVYDLGGGSPTTATAILKPLQPTGVDQFGSSVAMAGGKVIIGAPGVSGFNDGRAHLFNLDGLTPTTPLASISSPQSTGEDYFGFAVGISVDQMVIGAKGNDAGAVDAGSVYVYSLQGGSLSTPTLSLNHPGERPGENFGNAVAMSGSRLAVGAFIADVGTATDSGAVFVYDLNGASPQTPSIAINNPTQGPNEYFGWSLDISGSLMAVGAYGDDTGAGEAGRVDIFDLDSASPTVPVFVLNNPDAIVGATGGRFGWSVAIDGNLLVVGARFYSGTVSGGGAAYVFDLSSTTPTVPIASLYNPTPETAEFFGDKVAIDGHLVVVGAYRDNTGASSAGSAYVYDLTTVNPAIPALALNNPSPEQSDFFGASVAISGSRVVVGAWADNSGVDSAGSAYVYDLNSDTPTVPVLEIPNPYPAPNDYFGYSVALEGSRLVLGAVSDDSSLADSGTAYVFDLNSLSPAVPFAMLENPAPGMDDFFGYSVALDGETVVVGARYDDSTGADRGGVYVFGPGGGAHDHFAATAASAGLVGGNAGATATPLGDGVANLLKYAFNMNLTGPDVRIQERGGAAGGLPAIDFGLPDGGGGPVLRFEYVRRIGSGLVYSPQKSFNLDATSWMPLTTPPVVSPIDLIWERVVHEEPVNPTLTPQGFGRVRVELP